MLQALNSGMDNVMEANPKSLVRATDLVYCGDARLRHWDCRLGRLKRRLAVWVPLQRSGMNARKFTMCTRKIFFVFQQLPNPSFAFEAAAGAPIGRSSARTSRSAASSAARRDCATSPPEDARASGRRGTKTRVANAIRGASSWSFEVPQCLSALRTTEYRNRYCEQHVKCSNYM